MAKVRANYEPGTWFLVPLRDGGYARGVVARMNGRGIVFGYFFGPRLSDPDQPMPNDLSPEDRVLWGQFGDPGLTKGEWPILGVAEGWNPSDWPMPPFVRIDEDAGVAFLSRYDEETLECTSEERCSRELAKTHPYDRLMGYGAVEIRLTKLLP